MVVKAYVLINVDTPLTKETLEALSRQPHVREVNELLGPFDAVAEFEVEEFSQVAEILRREIRTVPGVRNTVTCVAIGPGLRGGRQEVETRRIRGTIADVVRAFAYQHYIQPARQMGKATVSIRAGDVHKEMGLNSSGPTVCDALEGKKFLSAYNLRLVSREGPRKGFNVFFTYELL